MKLLNKIAKLLGIHSQRDYELESRTLKYVQKFLIFRSNVLFTQAYNIKGRSVIRLYVGSESTLKYKTIAGMGHFFKATVEVYKKVPNQNLYENEIDIIHI